MDPQAPPPASRVRALLGSRKAALLGAGTLLALGLLGGGLTCRARRARLARAQAAPPTPTTPPHHGEAEDGCAHDHAKDHADAAPVMVLTRMVNLQGPRRNAFLRCELNILFCDPELAKLASADKPSAEKSQIQAIVLDALTGKTVEEASEAASRESLRLTIRDRLNARFQAPPPRLARPIRNVLIVDWAIQQ